MYVPELYDSPDDDRARDIIRMNPLGLLVGNATPAPLATHVPVVSMPGGPDEGRLVGTILYGHMNRANPHWSSLSSRPTSRLAFAGPHAYITPSIYSAAEAAPTWNFTAVHVIGSVEPLPIGEATVAVVRRTAEVFEALFGDGWDHGSSEDYFRRIVKAVGAFRFRIRSVESMFKLSQEKDAETRRRVVDWLSGSSSGRARDLSALMRSYDSGPVGSDPSRR